MRSREAALLNESSPPGTASRSKMFFYVIFPARNLEILLVIELTHHIDGPIKLLFRQIVDADAFSDIGY